MRADTPRQTLTDLFRDHGQDLPLGLSVALIAADERPEVEVDGLLRRLDDLAAEIPIRGGAPLFESIARLHMSLFTELGLRGDEQTYGDPRNSCLDQVLERRMGQEFEHMVRYYASQDKYYEDDEDDFPF